MAPPIKCGLGYRSRTRTRTLKLTLTLKVTIMYAVQNDTEIVQHSVICKSFVGQGQGVGIQKAYTVSKITDYCGCVDRRTGRRRGA